MFYPSHTKHDLPSDSSRFAKTYDEVQQSKFECKKAEFHTQLVTTVLAGFSVPSSVVSGLHKALDTISKGMVTASSTNSSQSMQYFIMLTRYEWQAPSQTMQPGTYPILPRSKVSNPSRQSSVSSASRQMPR